MLQVNYDLIVMVWSYVNFMQVCSSSFWTHQVHPDITACAERWGAHSRLWLWSRASRAEGPWSPWLVQAGAGRVPAETPGSHRAIRERMICPCVCTCIMTLWVSCSSITPSIPWSCKNHLISRQFLCIILWNSSGTVHYQQRCWSTMQDTRLYWRHISAQMCCFFVTSAQPVWLFQWLMLNSYIWTDMDNVTISLLFLTLINYI